MSILLVARAGAARAGDADGGEYRVDARTISGTVSALVWSEAKLTVVAPDGPVTLTFDRNTAVFLENRLGSVRDLTVGTPVRASFGSDKKAVWVEVRARASSGADGGTAYDGGPGADAAQGPPVLPPPPGETGMDAGPGDGGAVRPPADGGAPSPAPGNVPEGPAPPEPNPGVTPPRPPRPGPTGPGPVPGGPER